MKKSLMKLFGLDKHPLRSPKGIAWIPIAIGVKAIFDFFGGSAGRKAAKKAAKAALEESRRQFDEAQAQIKKMYDEGVARIEANKAASLADIESWEPGGYTPEEKEIFEKTLVASQKKTREITQEQIAKSTVATGQWEGGYVPRKLTELEKDLGEQATGARLSLESADIASIKAVKKAKELARTGVLSGQQGGLAAAMAAYNQAITGSTSAYNQSLLQNIKSTGAMDVQSIQDLTKSLGDLALAGGEHLGQKDSYTKELEEMFEKYGWKTSPYDEDLYEDLDEDFDFGEANSQFEDQWK